MKTLFNKQYTGKRSKTGGICFDEKGRMKVFVTYCECRGKVVMDVAEAQSFANKYRTEESKRSTKKLLKLVNLNRL